MKKNKMWYIFFILLCNFQIFVRHVYIYYRHKKECPILMFYKHKNSWFGFMLLIWPFYFVIGKTKK